MSRKKESVYVQYRCNVPFFFFPNVFSLWLVEFTEYGIHRYVGPTIFLFKGAQ